MGERLHFKNEDGRIIAADVDYEPYPHIKVSVEVFRILMEAAGYEEYE